MSLLDHPEAQALLADAEVSADDVRGCRDHITRFLKRYLPLFYRQEQRGHAAAFVRGLLSGLPRKSVEPIAAQAGVPRKNLQLFVGSGGWDDEAVMAEIAAARPRGVGRSRRRDRARPQRLPQEGRPTAAAWPASGAAGWARRRTARLGVFLAYVSSKGHAPLDRRLYLPKDWADDPARREECHVPADVTYRKTWEIAHDLLRRERAGAAPQVGRRGRRIRPGLGVPRGAARATASGTCSTCRATPTSATSTAAGRRARRPTRARSGRCRSCGSTPGPGSCRPTAGPG